MFDNDQEIDVAISVPIANRKRTLEIGCGEVVAKNLLGACHKLPQHGVQIRVGCRKVAVHDVSSERPWPIGSVPVTGCPSARQRLPTMVMILYNPESRRHRQWLHNAIHEGYGHANSLHL